MNFFSQSLTTFTTAWSWEKTVFFISALRSLRHGHKIKKSIFIAPMSELRCDHEKIFLFFISLRCSLCKYFLIHHLTSTYYAHYVTGLPKKSPSLKNIHNLKSRLRSRFDITLSFLNINHINLKPHARFWVYSSNHCLIIFKLPG